jgi:Rod binding domain-containing protein
MADPVPTVPVSVAAAAPSPKNAAARGPEAVRSTAEDFEAFFISQMLDHMFAGIKTDGLFGGGAGEDTYRGLLNQEYGKAIARSGGIGLADTVTREILKMQEAEKP